eukprot:g40738.t1
MALSSWSLDWPAEATEGKRSMVKSFGAIFSLDGTQLAEDILELTATRSSDDHVAAHKLRVAELAKELDLRQKEVDALAGDIQAQMKIAEEGGEAADGAGAELARLLALKGQFSKRIAELKNQREVDVSVTAHEVTTVVKLPAGSFRQFPGASKPLCWCPQVVAEQSTREITKTIKMRMETAESTPLRLTGRGGYTGRGGRVRRGGYIPNKIAREYDVFLPVLVMENGILASSSEGLYCIIEYYNAAVLVKLSYDSAIPAKSPNTRASDNVRPLKPGHAILAYYLQPYPH